MRLVLLALGLAAVWAARQPTMERVAVGTGGEIDDASQGMLEEQLRHIAEDLRAFYELRYYSSNPTKSGSFRNVEIRPKTVGLTGRATPGYFAE